MQIPKNLSMRQTLEGMTTTFNPDAMPGLEAIIQFDISGQEPGIYHLEIKNGECYFHIGAAHTPTITIITPSEVWLKISRGEMTGYDALMQELYTATGEITLLMKMDSLFKKAREVTYEAPASQRPAGPISLPGMTWMTLAFIPWIIHWSTFDIPNVSHWISVGLPLLFSALIVGYRLAVLPSPFGRGAGGEGPTFMEWGGLAFFTFTTLLALTGAPGYTEWGSVVSSFVMAGLWLSSLQFARLPLSGDYSKWGFIKQLWRNSMFIYPNAVISLMWGWQFIAASSLGIAAIFLPEQKLIFTLTRYLLLIPAFIFTSTYQKRVPISNPRLNDTQLRFWAGIGLSAVSGFLLTASMPGFDVPFIGWVALVPLLIILLTAETKHIYPLALPFGIVFSIGVHNWYPNIFSPALGYFLIFAVGTYYAGVLQLGIWLYSRLPAPLKILGLPVSWAAIEFVKYITPVIEDWWFVLLADSAWRFPAALQILSFTGVFGLSFIIMWMNTAIAAIIIHLRQTDSSPQAFPKSAVIAALLSALIVGAGALSLRPAENGFKIAVLTDMVNQDPLVLAQGEFAGTRVTSPEVSQAIFDTDAALARSIASEEPALTVFPENEFADADDTQFISQLGSLAQETNAYIAADVLWNASTGLHDTALLVSPKGEESARRAKINITSGEADAGIVAGPREFSSTSTPYGNVGISVCWDVHRLWIIRELARSGAQIILLPMDNDFNGIATFPPFHAADAVFRAVENRVTFGLGTINGLSLVIDPYGRITAEGKINERGVTVGETFVVNAETLYTRFGDWFGWTLVTATFVLIAIAFLKKDKA